MNRALSITLLLATMLHAGCGPCADFDEMVIHDDEDVLSGSDRNNIQYAIDTFAAWTGRSGVCVPGVAVSANLSDRDNIIQGEYRGPWQDIQVAKDYKVNDEYRGELSYAVDLTATTRHELCHAFDLSEQVTHTYGANFRISEALQENSNYRTNRKQKREAFALRCEDGPKLSLWEETYSQCGIDVRTRYKTTTSIDSVIQTVVYSAAERLEPEPGGWPMHISSPEWVSGAMWLNEVPRLLGLEEGILALGLVQTPPSIAQTLGLFLIDPHTASVVRQIPVPFSEGEMMRPSMWGMSLLMTEGHPRLVLERDHITRSWAVDVSAGTTHELPTLPTLEVNYGFNTVISNGFVFTADTIDGFQTLRAYDAISGKELDLGLSDSDAWGFTVYVDRLWPTDDGLTLFSFHEGLSKYNIDSGTWRHDPIPYWWNLENPVALGDDRYLFKNTLETDVAQHINFVLYDQKSNQWWLPEEPCTSTTTEYVSSIEFLSAAGSVWLTDYGAVSSGRLSSLDPEVLNTPTNNRGRIRLRLRHIDVE